MFYSFIRLLKCNRTALNGKQEIIIRPTTKNQLILGTNGGGKSSLLEVGFTPIPPEPHNFDSGGEWEVIFTHKGHTYHQIARYGDKNTYSFIVDGGENLNRGRTITAQLELVKEHIGYTRELHHFLLGKIQFTSMKAKGRQDWISKFSAVDFVYAFSLLKQFKDELNTHVKVAGYLQNKLNETREKLMDPADVESMRRKADELHETLELLMREPKHGEDALNEQQLAQRVDEALNELSKFIYREYPRTQNADSIEQLVELRSEAEAAVHLMQGELKVRGQRLEECDQKKQRVEKLGQFSPEELQASMETLESQLAAIPPQVSQVHPSLLNNYQRPVTELRSIVGRLPSVKRTMHDVFEIKNVVLDRRTTLNRYKSVLEDIDLQLDYIGKCEVVQCPKCAAEFKPGIAEGKQEELTQRRQKGQALVNEVMASVDIAEDELQSTSNIAETYAELDAVRAAHQNTCPGLFQYLDTFGWTQLGRGLSEKIAIFVKDCERQEQRDNLQRHYDTLKSRLEIIRAEAGQSVQVLDDYHEALREYNAVHATHQAALVRKSRLDKSLLEWNEYLQLYERAEKHYTDLREEVLAYSNRLGDQMIETLIRNTKITIGVHEQALAENQACLDAVKDLENQVRTARIEEEARRRLVDAMSPKTGLIAEQINLQMSSIIGAVNSALQRIWNYPLYISTGEAGDTEMDYTLPMMVDRQPRPDISAGSSSIKHIIDQAFRLTGYYCMNLTDYPLFLDELGGSFDEVHRYNLIPLIKDLADDPRFSQVLLISHSLDGQTAFPNSQVIILDDRNINYPHPYNQHVSFT